VFLTVVRSHVLIGSFGSLGFIHPHVVIANTAVADAEAAAEVSTVRCWSSAPDAFVLREANLNHLTSEPFMLLETEAILSTSSISLIISAPRSTIVKPTLVRDSSTTVSNVRGSVAEAAPVSVSVSVPVPIPLISSSSYRERAIARGPNPPRSCYAEILYVRRPRQ
jgi:hypothetical protein